jgi:hypothetical protein
MNIKAKYNPFLRWFDQAGSHETVLMAANHYVKDDFDGADTVIPAAGSPESGVRWVKKIVGAAPPTLAKKADAACGMIEAALTADSQKQNAEIYTDDQRVWSLENGLIFEARVKLSVLPTLAAEAVIGLVGDWADGLDATTYNVFFTMDGSGEIFCEMDDNATDRSTTSGVTLTTSDWAVLRIDATDISDVKFYVNGNAVATGTTFAYAATGANAVLQPIAGMYKASGAGLGTLLVDYIMLAQERA